MTSTAERFGDPTVTASIARIIDRTTGTPNCPACDVLTPCAAHLAEALVNAMREQELVVLTNEAADQVLAHAVEQERTHLLRFVEKVATDYRSHAEANALMTVARMIQDKEDR